MNWLDDSVATRQGKSNLTLRSQFKEDEDTQSLYHEENLAISPDIILTSESIAEAGEYIELGFTFSTQKASKRVSKTVQKSENKWQRIKGARRADLLDDMAFFLNKDLCDCKKKKKSQGKKYRRLFCKSLAERNAPL